MTVLVLVLVVATFPLIYYLLAIYSSIRFFAARERAGPSEAFTPPVSNLKPVKGLDPEVYENFASLCRQDYPDYELLFCVDAGAPVLQVLEKLQQDFPERSIRVLVGSGSAAPNDKAAKLARLVREARHEVLVISDSDVRARPDYLKRVVAPLADAKVGAVTLPYVPLAEDTFADKLQWVGMYSDFYAGILVAKQLDGVKFALGPTIATRRSELEKFGGYEAIDSQPGDDLLVGRLVAEQGSEVVLLRYAVETVADFGSMRDLLRKRLRWMTVMRHMRPAGHFGLVFTWGLPWCLVAIVLCPTAAVVVGYLGAYLALRMAMTWVIGGYGLKQRQMLRRWALIPLWDAVAFAIWIISFVQSSVRWRGSRYYIRNGQLVPVTETRSGQLGRE